ncbi:MAG: YeeE/YedE thiosulfate transporter family protein [bacterium]
MGWLSMEQWSPYIVGVGIGILSWLAFLISDRQLACSTAYSHTSGMIERLFRGAAVMDKPYYKKFVPSVDWEWMLVVGIVIGAFISASLSGQFHVQWVPAKWAYTFGHLICPRLLVALAGGIIMGFGARWGGGCTSGHGISGTLQLAVSSWLASICFFAGGIVTAMLIFKVFVG